MKNFWTHLILSFAMVLCFVACDDDDDNGYIPLKIVLDKTDLVLTVAQSQTLTATVTPELLPDQKVEWATSNSEVASVDDGVVTALATGRADITARVGEASAVCTSRSSLWPSRASRSTRRV